MHKSQDSELKKMSYQIQQHKLQYYIISVRKSINFYMNKSIMKTRNQLERITYKINQLKNKYAGENYVQFGYQSINNFATTNVLSNQKKEAKDRNRQQILQQKQKYQARNRKQSQQIVLKDSLSPNIACQINKNSSQKKTKFIQKQPNLSESKVSKSLHQHRKSVPVVSAAIQAIEFEAKYEKNNQYVTNSQLKGLKAELAVYIDKAVSAKIKSVYQQKIQKQNFQQIQQKVRDYVNQMLSKRLPQKIQQIQHQNELNDPENRITKIQEELTNCLANMEQIHNRLDNVEDRFEIMGQQKGDINDENNFGEQLQYLRKQTQQLIENLEQKIQRNNDGNFIDKLQQTTKIMKQQLNQISHKNDELKNRLTQKIEEFQTKLDKLSQQNNKNSDKDDKNILEMVNISKKIGQLQNNIKLSLNQIVVDNKLAINEEMDAKNQNIAQLWLKIGEIQKNLTTTNKNKTTMPQDKLQSMITSISQQIKQIKIKYDQLNQLIQTYQYPNQSNTIKSSIKQQLKQQLKSQIKQQIKQIITKYHIPSKQQPQAKTDSNNLYQQITNQVQEKLNSFETDINETIKLLYEDIQKRVMQMINNIQPQIVYNSQNNQQDMGSNNAQIINLRQQLSETVAVQIDRLGDIVERTVQQIQLKMEKLDDNFKYIYNRMSKIEYDNAIFKDGLSMKQRLGNIEEIPKPRTQKADGDNSLLNILGSLNNGQEIGSLGII